MLITLQPFLSISNDVLDFGDQFIYTIGYENLTVTNTGTDTLTVYDISIDHPYFNINGATSFALTPEGNIDLEITF